MVATYILIIAISAMLAALVGLRLWLRLAPMLGNRLAQLGVFAMAPAVAFLIVVGAPASLLFFTCAIMVLMLLAPVMMQRIYIWGVVVAFMIVAVLAFIPFPNRSLGIPLTAVIALSYAVWLSVVLSAPQTPSGLRVFALSVIAVCVPLTVTPLILNHASSVAVDAAILASGWFGVLLLAQPHHQVGKAAQIGAALIIGYLQITACWQGACPATLASLIVWCAALGVTVVQRVKVKRDRLAELLPYV